MAVSVDHIGIGTSDYEKSKAFYVAALAPLGIKIMSDYGVTVGMGEDFPFLWLSAGNPGYVHLAFRSPDRATVDAFYAAAIAAGGTDNGAPGERPEYHRGYYGAFVLDPDGNNVEVVDHNRSG